MEHWMLLWNQTLMQTLSKRLMMLLLCHWMQLQTLEKQLLELPLMVYCNQTSQLKSLVLSLLKAYCKATSMLKRQLVLLTWMLKSRALLPLKAYCKATSMLKRQLVLLTWTLKSLVLSLLKVCCKTTSTLKNQLVFLLTTHCKGKLTQTMTTSWRCKMVWLLKSRNVVWATLWTRTQSQLWMHNSVCWTVRCMILLLLWQKLMSTSKIWSIKFLVLFMKLSLL